MKSVLPAGVETMLVNGNTASSTKCLEYHNALQYRGFLSTRGISVAGRKCLFEAGAVHSEAKLRRHCQDARFADQCMQEEGSADGKPEAGDELTHDMVTKFGESGYPEHFLPADPSAVKVTCIDGHDKAQVKRCGPPPPHAGRPGMGQGSRSGTVGSSQLLFAFVFHPTCSYRCSSQ